jgi:hypothetical protein
MRTSIAFNSARNDCNVVVWERNNALLAESMASEFVINEQISVVCLSSSDLISAVWMASWVASWDLKSALKAVNNSATHGG